MRRVFAELVTTLTSICPTFMHILPRTAYPHILIADITILRALPQGPAVASFKIKMRSQYPGTREILVMLQEVEKCLYAFRGARIKVLKSSLSVLPDGKTREHTLQIKARVSHA